MEDGTHSVLQELRDMLKILGERQESLIKDINELKDNQRKLEEEVRLSNFVLNNFSFRSELIN